MYAVVQLAGKQFMMKPEERVKVPLLDAEPGSVIKCEDVLVYADGSDVRVGRPHLDGISVTAEVLEHGRDKKIIVFKMKRRKGYRRKNGHRQGYTLLKVKEISG
ncbi:MAG: 50S ribosomal protein L21 [Candidatus Krumholzibacteria bacterium]|nr:50S ribosomal protein L21 [Candidatus Krumholzibacteria bacterium]